MIDRLMVTEDAEGTPMALIPLPLLWYLEKRFPTKRIVTAYDHATNRALVNFPGWDAPAVQYVLDDLSGAAAAAASGVGTGPGRFSYPPELTAVAAGSRAMPAAVPADPVNEAIGLDRLGRYDALNFTADDCAPLPVSTTGSVLTDLRHLMDGLTLPQQDQLSHLVFDLKTTLAAERLCFHQLFETAPDGYAVTDLEGNIQHANDAMYQLLQVAAPDLDGMPLPMFFTPSSKTFIQKCLGRLGSGKPNCPPFADIGARITLDNDRELVVAMRLIVIQSSESAPSTIRWLIRDLT